jgi:hypothetical protein
MQTNNLTTDEQNVVKDILKLIGRDENLNTQFARAVGMSPVQFNSLTDSAFEKLGNGRVTFDYGENRQI